MPHARRFRFGAEMMAPFEGMSWADSARKVESLGYSTLFVPDHFHEGFGPITAMATAAMATTTLKVCPLVLDCDFRQPAVLARELASIDVLSEGRLEVGLRAGYNPLDYSRSGITMDEPRVRVDRLIEHTTVLKLLFGDEPVNYVGEHYRIVGLNGTPKPHRPGGPPILVAGGAKRVLRFAAQTADIVGVNVTISGSPDTSSARDALPNSIDEKLGWMRDAAGGRLDELELNAWVSVAHITTDIHEYAQRLTDRFQAPIDEILESPMVLVGSESEVIDRLHQRRDRWGYSYFVIQGPKVDAFASVVARATGT